MKLELNNVSCGYKADAPIIKNVNISMDGGEVCCILGPNGVGKTTLFKTILNINKPLDGAIYIDGEDAQKWSVAKRSRCMAYVAQAHTPSFPYLVREVAMMGRMGRMSALSQPTKKDYEIVEQALEDVQLRHLRDVPYSEISGGERQLLMIARALAQQPQLLVMDEPTANLDYGNMVLVMETIHRLAESGMSIVFTSHMPDQAFMCRAKTALLLRGQPPIFGESDSVITEKNLFQAYQTQIQILQVVDADGNAIKVVVPRLRTGKGNIR